MQDLKKLLLPFSTLYGAGVKLRNWLYDKKFFDSKGFDIPIICIGNLSVGGTGKTPMAEYILDLLLEKNYKPALLSRGYKRKSSGFLEVSKNSTADIAGDEPCQVKRKFPGAIVAVCEKRVEGVERILKDHPEINVIVLDDAMQHRQIKPGFTILLTDATRPFYKDFLLPAGMLRENIEGKNRADVIIVTKCHELPDREKKQKYLEKIKPHYGQEVFFTGIRYVNIVKVGLAGQPDQRFELEHLKGFFILLLTGIANPQPLKHFLEEQHIKHELMAFADHHKFTQPDIEKIQQHWQRLPLLNKLLLTTEKDWRRLEGTPEGEMLRTLPLYFLPIEMEWKHEEKSSFDRKILHYVSTNKGSS